MAASAHAWYLTKKDLMKPLKEGGTDWINAVKYRQAMYLFITHLGRKLDLYVPIFYIFFAILLPIT